MPTDARFFYLLQARRIRNTTRSIARTIAKMTTGTIFTVKKAARSAPRITPSVKVKSALMIQITTSRQRIREQQFPPSKLSVILFTPKSIVGISRIIGYE